MSKSFRDLQPYEALALGIAVETRNAQRYNSFSLMFAGYDDDVSSLFTEMREEELRHRTALEDLYRAHFGDRPCTLDEADVDDVVEAVDIDDAEHVVFDTMTLKNVLEAALRAEQGAQQFYAELSRTAQGKDLLALYRELGENEQDHVAAVEDRIRQLDAQKGAHHGRLKIELRVIQPEARPDPEPPPGRIDLFAKMPWLGRLFKMRAFPAILIIPNLIMFWIFLLAGIFGSPVGNHNIIIVFIWILWWFALIVALVPFGSRLWCTMCPLPFFGDWVQRHAVFKVRPGNSIGTRNQLYGRLLRWPKPLSNIWAQNIGFLCLATFSAHLVTRPMATVIMLGGLIVIAAFMGLIWRQRVFCNYVCPVSGFLSLYSMTSTIELRSASKNVCKKCTSKACAVGSDKGWACPWFIYMGGLQRNNYCGMCTECIKSCPNDNIRLYLRPFCSDTVLKGYDEIWKAFIMLVLAMAYSVVLLGPWGKIKDWANVAEVGNWRNFAMYASILWFSALAGLPAVYYLAIRAGRWIASRGSAGEASAVPSMKDLFIRYGYTLIPLGLMAWIAFSFPLIMVSGAYIISVISDPMGRGWNLFGTAEFPWAPFHPEWLATIQIPCLLFGLYYSLLRGHELALGLWGDNRRAIRSLLPLVVLLTAITAAFLRMFIG